MRATGIHVDINQMVTDCQTVINSVGWGGKSQIGFKHRPHSTDPWFDSAGTLWDFENKKYHSQESDFSEWNAVPNSLKFAIGNLAELEKVKFGRIRLMRMVPKTGLTVHRDSHTRYHFVITTNPKSYFCYNIDAAQGSECRALCYHMPCDGQWYHCDTTRTHWVYNGGDSDRIHLVCNVL